MTTTSSSPRLLDPARFVGDVDGRATALFFLRNAQGMVVAVTNLGAKILQIAVPDRHGALADVVLGYDRLADVITGSPSMGAFVGRYAGRMGGARFTLDGREHLLTPNAGPHCIHGGPRGSRHRVFDTTQVDARTLRLHHRFHTAEDRFPGTLDLQLTYRLDDDNALVLEHTATALDEPGPASFTCHAYFNLDGVDQGQRIDGHTLQVPSDTVLATGIDGIATGQRVPLEGHAQDLRSASRLGDLPDIDLSYVLAPNPVSELRRCAQLHSEASGRTLDVWTTEPLLQVYTAGQLGVAPQPDLGKWGCSTDHARPCAWNPSISPMRRIARRCRRTPCGPACPTGLPRSTASGCAERCCLRETEPGPDACIPVVHRSPPNAPSGPARSPPGTSGRTGFRSGSSTPPHANGPRCRPRPAGPAHSAPRPGPCPG